MANHVLLDNIAHKNLRVRSHAPGVSLPAGTVVVFPTEFQELQREYPLFFRRDEKGEFYAVALLGFSKDENLYLEGDRWDAFFLPGLVTRGPFLIGFQERQEGGEPQRQPVIHIDLDDPRVSETEGERVFLEQGGHSPYLQRVARVLAALNDGLAVSKPMFDALVSHGLIAPVEIEVKTTVAEAQNLAGFFSISREKLAQLDAEAVHKLHRAGFLQAAYLVLASQANLNLLIERKVRRLAQAAA